MLSSKKEQFVIAYNEARSVLENMHVTEGGPARFSVHFRKFFTTNKTQLKPLIFSYIKQDGFSPELKKHTIGKQDFFEIIYNAERLHSLYKQDVSKKDFEKELAPVIQLVEKWLQDSTVDLVFLNGFSLLNWVFLKAADRAGVPIVSQHAGVWKKEVFISGQTAFSAGARRAFYDMERDLYKWSTHHIFLNQFSKQVFIDSYNCENSINKKVSIIPLPIDFKNNQKRISKESISIGMVARWDRIKNHAAFLRLADSPAKPKGWELHSVVKIPPTSTSSVAAHYKEKIKIHEPMEHGALGVFYKQIDVLVLPSYFETFGGVAAEAFLSGTPVIVSKTTGFSELLHRFKLDDHIIEPSISGRKMVKIIQGILQKKQAYQKKYNMLIEYLRKEHNPQKVFSAYSTIFTKVANKNSN